MRGTSLDATRRLCREHLALTHPDASLAEVCDAYVELIDGLLFRESDDAVQDLLLKATRALPRRALLKLVEGNHADREVVGRKLSPACYISESWPAVLYFACKHQQDPLRAMRANAEVGGDNVHRGAVLGVLLGLIHGAPVTDLFEQLTEQHSIRPAIERLVVNS